MLMRNIFFTKMFLPRSANVNMRKETGVWNDAKVSSSYVVCVYADTYMCLPSAQPRSYICRTISKVNAKKWIVFFISKYFMKSMKQLLGQNCLRSKQVGIVSAQKAFPLIFEFSFGIFFESEKMKQRKIDIIFYLFRMGEEERVIA